jgi:hypothetical protein
MKKLFIVPAIVLLCSFTTIDTVKPEIESLEITTLKLQNGIIWGEWSEWSDPVRNCGSRNRIGYDLGSNSTVIEFQDQNCLPGNDDGMHDPDGPQ